MYSSIQSELSKSDETDIDEQLLNLKVKLSFDAKTSIEIRNLILSHQNILRHDLYLVVNLLLTKTTALDDQDIMPMLLGIFSRYFKGQMFPGNQESYCQFMKQYGDLIEITDFDQLCELTPDLFNLPENYPLCSEEEQGRFNYLAELVYKHHRLIVTSKQLSIVICRFAMMYSNNDAIVNLLLEKQSLIDDSILEVLKINYAHNIPGHILTQLSLSVMYNSLESEDNSAKFIQESTATPSEEKDVESYLKTLQTNRTQSTLPVTEQGNEYSDKLEEELAIKPQQPALVSLFNTSRPNSANNANEVTPATAATRVEQVKQTVVEIDSMVNAASAARLRCRL